MPPGPRARRLAGLVARHAVLVVVLGLVLGVLAAVGAGRVQLDGRLRRLLPDDAPAIAALDESTARLGSQSDLYITIESPSSSANRAFGCAVEERLKSHPDLRFVQVHREVDFFRTHALLYADLADLLALRRRVIERIRDEVRVRAYGGFSVLPQEDREPPPPLDIDAEVRQHGPDDVPSEFFETDDGRLLVVRARPSFPAQDVVAADRLRREIEAIVEALNPGTFEPGMKVRIDGEYAQHGARVDTLRREVFAGTAISILGVLACLVWFFRSARAVVLVLLPVIVASTGALAFAAFVLPPLNLVSAFVFGVLVGLGIDFQIHMLARLRAEQALGYPADEALARTYAGTGRSTAAGALGTTLAFAALSAGGFEGFAQFGAIAAVGLLLALLGALVWMPAAWIVLDRVRPWAPAAGVRRRVVLGFLPAGRGMAGGVLAIGLVLAGLGAWRATRIEFQHDLDALGPRPRVRIGPRAPSYRDAIGRAATLAPAVIVTDSALQAEMVWRQLAALETMTVEEAVALENHRPHEPEGDGPEGDDGDDDLDFPDRDLDDPRFTALEALARTRAATDPDTLASLVRYGPERRATMVDRLAAVASIHAFVPPDQEAKLQVIADIRARIDRRWADLSEKTRAELRTWDASLRVGRTIGLDDLPESVRAPFLDAQGRADRLVVFWTHGAKADVDNARRIRDAFGTLQTREGEVVVAAEFFVIPAVIDAIESDGPWVMLAAWLAMLVTAAISLRGLVGPAAVALVVSVTLAWLLGAMAALGLRLDVFNVIVLPLLVGMAQDDALHVVERWRTDGVRRALRDAGGAVAVTTATTICGFAGILLADHRGLTSLAITAVAGMALAWIAAVVVLPCALMLVPVRTVASRASASDPRATNHAP